jgi:hypothetical protein
VTEGNVVRGSCGFEVGERTITGNSRIALGYFNGEKSIMNVLRRDTSKSEYDREDVSVVVGQDLCTQSKRKRHAEGESFLTATFIDGAVNFYELVKPNASNYVHESAGIDCGNYDRTTYSGIDPPVRSGQTSSWSFNGRVANAVLGQNGQPDKFRGIPVDDYGNAYVAEASPLGEIFFAKKDKSVIIHEPLPGGIKKFAIPPGLDVIRILGAAWL